MTEREMEDLIAMFPSDFFPRRELVLKGRQGSFSGVGRFDLLFEDQFQTTFLMELKARPGKYDDASQLARYKDELDRLGKRVVMWLVAPHIPNSVREFLDHIASNTTKFTRRNFGEWPSGTGSQLRPQVPLQSLLRHPRLFRE
ncbi:MAG: endonuclease NucS domain-containing protein [Bryobacteraceae bacterium]